MPGRRFAEGTEVPVERSRVEIEQTLQRYGATAFAYAWHLDGATVAFEANGRRVQLDLPLPDPHEERFAYEVRRVNQYKGGERRERRTPEQAQAAWERECRRAWRALALVIKAKLEAVATGITTFEEEFLAHTVVPGADGRPTKVGALLLPQVALAYESGKAMPLELMPGSAD